MVLNASGLTWIGPHELLFSAFKLANHKGIATSNDQRGGLRDIYFPPNGLGQVFRSYLSPDRKWVLAAQADGSGWLPCRLVPFDGNSPGRQVGPKRSCTSAAWSPDGKWMYFSSMIGGAFHIWRQQFPGGPPEQITFGPTEEEGIAVSPEGRSLITSVGTGDSTIWFHDKNGDRPLSQERYSYNPQFSSEGRTVFYLTSRHARPFWAGAGELWSLNLDSGERWRPPVPGGIVSFALAPQADQVALVMVGPDDRLALWSAPLDGRAPPRKLADDVVRGVGVSQNEIVFRPRTAAFLELMGFDGANRRRSTFFGTWDVSPDGKWSVVMDRIPLEGVRSPVVLYPMGGDADSRIPLCSPCSVSWVLEGRYLRVRFGAQQDAEDRPTYLAPIPRGEVVPALFRTGRLVSEAEVAKLPGVRIVPLGDPVFRSDPDTYVYTKRTVHRNLFRIPLE